MEIASSLLAYFNDGMSLTVTESTHLIEEGIIDSMGVVDLIDYVSETYNIEFDGDELTEDNLATIGAFTKLIESKI